MRIIAILSLAFAGSLNAVLIPADRLISWSPGVNVGVPGGIPTSRTQFVDATQSPYNADKTGVTDATAAIQAAIGACPSGQYVYLPAGTYRMDNGIGLKADTTLKGAGMNSTILDFHGGSTAVGFGNGSPGMSQPWLNGLLTAGATGGSNTLTVSDTANYTVGMLTVIARLASTNQFDNPVVVGTGGPGGYPYLQMAKVTAKTATTITISPPIFRDMSDYAVWTYWGLYPNQQGVGIEDLTIDMDNSAGNFGVWFIEVQDSWLLRVRINKTKNYGVSMLNSLRCEVRGCYIGPSESTPSSNQAGLLLVACTSNLIEDNILVDEYPGVEMNTGSGGNVFAYNLMKNTNGYYAMDSNHGPHNTFNLFEGNVETSHVSDGYFGGESHGTIFRNWITGIGTGFTGDTIGYTVALKRFTRKYSLVGNILGAAGYTIAGDTVSLGQPNIGNSDSSGTAPPWADWGTQTGPGSFQELDTGVAADLVRKGNYNYYNSTLESLGGDTLPDSLFRSAKPAWFNSLTWPPINPSSTGTLTESQIMQKIPAGYRYINGTDPPTGPVSTMTIGTTNVINLRKVGP